MSRYTKANHRIFMQFIRRDVWHVTFLEPGLQKPLPKTLAFKDEGKIRELARRGEAWQTSEDRQLLDYAIAKGEGGVYLRLSPEQYARLRRPWARNFAGIFAFKPRCTIPGRLTRDRTTWKASSITA
jgi:hypothetical protein